MDMHNATLGLAVLLLSGVLCQAQQDANPPAESAVIEGSVVNAQNGRVVPRATIILRPIQRPATARSLRADEYGHFVFKDLDPGAYQLSADRQGFYSEAKRNAVRLRVEVSAGEARKDILLRLVPTAVITGQIVDENSDPIQHAQVKLLARSHRGGRVALDIAGLGLSDDRGQYRIYDIRPGHYYILVQVTAAMRAKGLQVVATTDIVGLIQTAGNSDAVPEPVITFAPLFYPDTGDLQQAQFIQLNPGDEVPVNFILLSKPSVSVQGKVVNGLSGEPAKQAAVTVWWAEQLESGISATVSPKEGVFEAGGLAPGRYLLRASFNEDQLTYTAQQTVEVGPHGNSNVLLVGLPDSEIAGRVRVEGTDAERQTIKRVAVQFRNRDNTGEATVSAGLPDLLFAGRLHPGDRYAVAVSGLPQDYYLKAVSVYGHQVPTDELVVSDRRSEIELTLSPAGGHIEGLVVDDRNQPISASVVLVPEAVKRDDRALFRRATANKQGKFTLRGVTPGTYQLLAFDGVDFEGLIDDPEAMKVWEGRGQTLSVDEKGNYSMALQIIATADPS